ncbi:unnamed protein product [Allacma fusca]|uniref:Uncharacterized protein n=1 Tax=Allacma fusca TaxID=39272 RepID=A0A8J2PRH3_9HEXA|nr:unnamed protein product [Allacma fusca]
MMLAFYSSRRRYASLTVTCNLVTSCHLHDLFQRLFIMCWFANTTVFQNSKKPFLLGSIGSLKKKIRYSYLKAHGNSNCDSTRGEIDVPVGLTKSVRETEFLLYDNHGQENRMLIFASTDALDYLARTIQVMTEAVCTIVFNSRCV